MESKEEFYFEDPKFSSLPFKVIDEKECQVGNENRAMRDSLNYVVNTKKLIEIIKIALRNMDLK